ncbi:MAG TPA: HD-GYP domain-containing protein [Candidatus Ozemobacteraceae bacterium]|nr:HD-GYP domain-containing protein [Candidatus Ozemobacteraceae bacterium]
MSNETVVSYPQIFSGFSHIGSCREFVWIHHPNAAECRFIMKDLHCGDSFENLMIRKDLFLCSESGEEYVVKDFQLLDISDPTNILGTAGYFGIMTDKFPEVKSSIPLQNAMVSKPTQLLAIRAVSTLISAVESEKAIPTRETREVAAQLIAEIARTPDAVLNLLAVRAYDDYTYAHNVNVATLSLMIGQAMGLSRNDLHSLGVGALLHDIGKLKVAKEILNKIGPLTPKEFDLIRQHPRVGYEMLRSSREIGEWSKLIVLQHHEKFQGGGYPAGLKGNEISVMARIVAIADVYDALTTSRPFRPAMSPYLSTKILLSNTENQFDPAILAVFLRRMSVYPPGSLVRLNTGVIAAVARSNPGAILRPIVRLLKDAQGLDVINTKEIDLLFEKNLYIVGPHTDD